MFWFVQLNLQFNLRKFLHLIELETSMNLFIYLIFLADFKVDKESLIKKDSDRSKLCCLSDSYITRLTARYHGFENELSLSYRT